MSPPDVVPDIVAALLISQALDVTLFLHLARTGASGATQRAPPDLRSTIRGVEVHRSARRHGIDDADMEHVVAHALAALDEDNDEGITQTVYLGWNRTGDALLEVVVLHFDDSRDMVIHAMKMHRQYTRYVSKGEEHA